MGVCFLKNKAITGVLQASIINPYADALVILPFNQSIANVGTGSDIYVPVSSGTINYAPGIKDNCYAATNASYVSFNNALADKMLGDWTLSFWFKLTTATNVYRRSLWYTHGSRYMSLGEFGRLNYQFYIGSAYGTKSYRDSLWHFAMIRKHGNTITAIIDGGDDTITNTGSFSSGTVTNALQISNSSYFLNGWIEYVCFWDRLVDDSECDYLWNGGGGNFL